MPRSIIHASRSKPCGLDVPCGFFKRTVMRHCSPPCTRGINSVAPRGQYHASCTRDGIRAFGVNTSFTCNKKRSLRAFCCGKSTTVPISSTSTPCQCSGSRWSSRRSARHAAHAKPSAAHSSATPARRRLSEIKREEDGAHNTASNKGNIHSQRAGGKSACCCSSQTPTQNAMR